MDTSLILQLFSTFSPLVLQIVQHYQKSHSGETPTDAQVNEIFNANIDGYLKEGADWKAQHPLLDDAMESPKPPEGSVG